MIKQVISVLFISAVLLSTSVQAKKKKRKDHNTTTEMIEAQPAPITPVTSAPVPQPERDFAKAEKPKDDNGIDKPMCKVGTPLPDYRIIKSDRSDFFTKNIAKDKNVFLVIFNPTCDHCQKQAMKYMEAQKNELKNTQIIYVCNQMLIDLIPEFETKIGYTPNPNFIIGVDTYDFVNELFEYRFLPQTIVYSKDKKVLKVFYKETEISDIVKILDK